MKARSFRKAVLGLCVFCVPMGIQAQQTVTTTGGTTGYIPKFSGAATVVKSQIFDNGTNVGIGVAASPNGGAKLDVGGAMIMRGNMTVSRTGNATASKAYPSYGFQFFSNAYNSSTMASDNPYFTLQSEPTGNNTASPSATFNLLFSNNGAAAAETGFYINPDGTLHFVRAQTFPIAAGPQGPAGPTGPTGPQGPAGPASALRLPYSATVDGGGNALFSITNGGTSGGGGIRSIGANSPDQQYLEGGSGLVGEGGDAGGQAAIGGIGVEGYGGSASYDLSNGGTGGYFGGGHGFNNGYGGTGIVVYGGGSKTAGQGGVAIIADSIVSGNYAGVFYGDVQVNGNLSKSGGSFKIDHPLDPANKYLSHSFVESPDMMNIYNGNVVTDGRGEAVVTMPDYFEALNRDFRYQLTIMGEQFAQARVARKIDNGCFVIRTDKPGVEVSWQVTGVRQDAWANAHRIPVAEDKPDKEKGHYTHPELFGHAGEPAIGQMKRPISRSGTGEFPADSNR